MEVNLTGARAEMSIRQWANVRRVVTVLSFDVIGQDRALSFYVHNEGDLLALCETWGGVHVPMSSRALDDGSYFLTPYTDGFRYVDISRKSSRPYTWECFDLSVHYPMSALAHGLRSMLAELHAVSPDSYKSGCDTLAEISGVLLDAAQAARVRWARRPRVRVAFVNDDARSAFLAALASPYGGRALRDMLARERRAYRHDSDGDMVTLHVSVDSPAYTRADGVQVPASFYLWADSARLFADVQAGKDTRRFFGNGGFICHADGSRVPEYSAHH